MKTKEELPACPVATAVALIGGKWKLLLTLPELPGPALLILVKAGHGPAENFSVVGHGVPSFTALYYHFMYFSMRELS